MCVKIAVRILITRITAYTKTDPRNQDPHRYFPKGRQFIMTQPQIIHNPRTIDFDRPGKALYEVAFHYDGTWGNALVPLAVINGTAGPGPGVACFGGTHGNEYEGQVAVWRLLHELDPAEISGRVLLMPRLNTPACISGTRESQIDGVNMNRAFPGDPRGTRGLALVALRSGRWMEARALLQEAASHSPPEAEPGPGTGWLLPFVDLLLARPQFKSEAESTFVKPFNDDKWSSS
jgi:hypothetical protein